MQSSGPESHQTGQAPRVSVVVPFLDPPVEFMTEAVESVLGQTYSDWELLLVNDGSGPEASSLARAYARRHPGRVRCLEHEGGRNRGISATRNLGVRHARGELVAFLDADDVWLPQKLEQQTRLLDRFPDAGMLFGRSLYWQSWTGRPEHRGLDHVPRLGVAPEVALPPPRAIPLFLTGEACVPSASSMVVRADVIRESGGFEEGFRTLYEDQAFYMKVALRTSLLPCSPVWDRYRLREDSTTGAASAEESRQVRATFLDWVEAYLTREGIRDSSLLRVVRTERWALRHPVGGRLLRSLRRLRWRARSLHSNR